MVRSGAELMWLGRLVFGKAGYYFDLESKTFQTFGGWWEVRPYGWLIFGSKSAKNISQLFDSKLAAELQPTAGDSVCQLQMRYRIVGYNDSTCISLRNIPGRHTENP
ncbi:hypothetical protein Bbelb_393570 [Branchiostoma belcheri]|nr:hypothetical protein Bbelb_393570 [Branchiostoma belcheri]